jgi:hypothetical protein
MDYRGRLRNGWIEAGGTKQTFFYFLLPCVRVVNSIGRGTLVACRGSCIEKGISDSAGMASRRLTTGDHDDVKALARQGYGKIV